MQSVNDLGKWLNDNWTGVLTLLNILSTAITLVVTVITVYQTWQLRRRQKMQMRVIKLFVIVPEDPNCRRSLPYRVLRSQLSRAELQGILGLYYMGDKRYDTKLLKLFFEQNTFNEMLEGKSDQLEIPVSKDQFDEIVKHLPPPDKQAP